MPSYSAHIRLGDHPGDLHLHFYYNKKNSRKLIGKYRIPSLTSLPGTEHDLNNNEIEFLNEWLIQKKQINKLQQALEETLFNMDEVGKKVIENIKEGTVEKRKGTTFVTVRFPVIKRLK